MKNVESETTQLLPPNMELGEFNLTLETDNKGKIRVGDLIPKQTLISPERTVINTGEGSMVSYSCIFFYPASEDDKKVCLRISRETPFRFPVDHDVLIINTELGEQSFAFVTDDRVLDLSEAVFHFQVGDLIRFTYLEQSEQVILDLVSAYSRWAKPLLNLNFELDEEPVEHTIPYFIFTEKVDILHLSDEDDFDFDEISEISEADLAELDDLSAELGQERQAPQVGILCDYVVLTAQMLSQERIALDAEQIKLPKIDAKIPVNLVYEEDLYETLLGELTTSKPNIVTFPPGVLTSRIRATEIKPATVAVKWDTGTYRLTLEILE
jgi:hypothetical protein